MVAVVDDERARMSSRFPPPSGEVANIMPQLFINPGDSPWRGQGEGISIAVSPSQVSRDRPDRGRYSRRDGHPRGRSNVVVALILVGVALALSLACVAAPALAGWPGALDAAGAFWHGGAGALTTAAGETIQSAWTSGGEALLTSGAPAALRPPG